MNTPPTSHRIASRIAAPLLPLALAGLPLSAFAQGLPTMEDPSRGQGSGILQTLQNYGYDIVLLIALLVVASMFVGVCYHAYQGHLRIAICDGLAQPRIATLLARSREEEPEMEIRVFELPFAQQLKTLHDDLLDIGFALSNAVHDGLVAEPVWTDPLSVIVPARHPLLAHVQVPLAEALKFPLVLCHPESGSGCRHQIQALLQDAGTPLKLVDEVTSLGVMLTLVGAGYGIGFAIASQVQTLQRPDISIRPLAGSPPVLSTYLLRRRGEPSEPMKRFIERAKGGRDRACR